MTVEILGYNQSIATRVPFPVRVDSVVATLRGSEEPDRLHVISGHYDSRVSDVLNWESDSPGANDEYGPSQLPPNILAKITSIVPRA